MIKSLHIINCESHKDTMLNFSPGLNVFIGDSDRGKSGVFRAYQLLTENEPGGNWMFPLYWDGTTEITATFKNPDGVVIRRKGKSVNEYILNGGDPVNAGTSVPEDIKKLIDVDDVNFQAQVERAFLMFETAGERGRILNRISGLDEIDQTLDNAKSDVAALTSNLKGIKKDIEEIEEGLKSFENIDEIDALLTALEEKSKERDQCQEKIDNLTKIKGQCDEIEQKISKLEPFIQIRAKLQEIEAAQKIADGQRKRIRIMKEISESIKRIREVEAKGSFEGFYDRLEEINQTKKKIDRIKLVLQQLRFFKKDLVDLDEDIKEKERAIADLKKRMPKSCPTCGRSM